MGHVDNVDSQLQAAPLFVFVDNVDNVLSCCPHDPHFLFAWPFLFARGIPARGFVDNVDSLDTRFKLVPVGALLTHTRFTRY